MKTHLNFLTALNRNSCVKISISHIAKHWGMSGGRKHSPWLQAAHGLVGKEASLMAIPTQCETR